MGWQKCSQRAQLQELCMVKCTNSGATLLVQERGRTHWKWWMADQLVRDLKGKKNGTFRTRESRMGICEWVQRMRMCYHVTSTSKNPSNWRTHLGGMIEQAEAHLVVINQLALNRHMKGWSPGRRQMSWMWLAVWTLAFSTTSKLLLPVNSQPASGKEQVWVTSMA